MTKKGEFNLSIRNEAFSVEVVEPTCQRMPQKNSESKNNREIKPFTNIVVPYPISEMYPICFKLALLMPLFFALEIVLVALKYYKYSIAGFAIAFIIIFGFIYQATSKFRGKRKFMKWLKILSLYSGIDCKSNLKLATAIQRYEEDPVLLKDEVTEIVIKHPFLIAIMESLCRKMPYFFLSYLISGSSREGFGKLLPSTSELASDFDIMLIPDGAVAAYPNQHHEAPLFLIEDQGSPEGFVWLKLNNHFLTKWDDLCLRKHIDNGSSYLSSYFLTKHVKNVISNSSELRKYIKNSLGFKKENIFIKCDIQGPAFNVKVKVKHDPQSCSKSWTSILFDADFTMAIHCPYWPEVARDFFENANRRMNWPDHSVIKTIQTSRCHVTPKPSADALIKLVSKQSENTTFGKAQYLEWRYSFSQAEIILSDNVPNNARTAFLGIKAVNKRHLHRKGAEVKSYALKCIFLSTLEKTPRTFWQNSDCDYVVEEFFLEILKELKSQLESRVCSNFWIHDINLFRDFKDIDFSLKLGIVNDVISNPKRFVADNYLEFVRCFTLKCFYCGSLGYIENEKIYQPINKNESRSCVCCSCNYSDSPWCCGSCQYNRVNVDVY